MLHASYDCIVVGAGISGLFATRELLKRHPSWRIALAERYKGLGGRTYSYWPPGFDGVHWEMGAGRIHKSHTMLMKLIEEYGLHWVPIPDTITYKHGPHSSIVANPFETLIVPLYLAPLQNLSEGVLATHTIQDLMEKLYGSSLTKTLLAYFPYRAEVNLMRADMALKGFLEGGEMSSHSGYGVLQEGFGELVARLRADIEARGATILNRHRLTKLVRASGKATDLTFEFGYKESGKPHGTIMLRAEQACVLALHKDAITELDAFKHWSVLNHLQTAPLLRCYAIFDTRGGPVWFSDLARVVTPMRPRYILPMNPAQGTIMISYTDADDTRDYMKLQAKGGDKALEKAIMKDIRTLFPKEHIPNPIFFRSHPWETGCTYWLPGSYSPVVASKTAIHPLPSKLPGVWLCGESWSLRQCWVEGALEHTREMLREFAK